MWRVEQWVPGSGWQSVVVFNGRLTDAQAYCDLVTKHCRRGHLYRLVRA